MKVKVEERAGVPVTRATLYQFVLRELISKPSVPISTPIRVQPMLGLVEPTGEMPQLISSWRHWA